MVKTPNKPSFVKYPLFSLFVNGKYVNSHLPAVSHNASFVNILSHKECADLMQMKISEACNCKHRVGSHVVFAWIHCTDVRIHCTDILIEYR